MGDIDLFGGVVWTKLGHTIIVIYEGRNTLTYTQIKVDVLHFFLYLLFNLLINQPMKYTI
jgi:hypothetical protein